MQCRRDFSSTASRVIWWTLAALVLIYGALGFAFLGSTTHFSEPVAEVYFPDEIKVTLLKITGNAYHFNLPALQQVFAGADLSFDFHFVVAMPPRPASSPALNDSTVIITARLMGNASINARIQPKGLSDESIYQRKDHGSVLLLRTNLRWGSRATFGLPIDIFSGSRPFTEAVIRIRAIVDDPISLQHTAPWFQHTFATAARPQASKRPARLRTPSSTSGIALA